MASFWSDYFKNKILDHIRGVATYTPGSNSYFALMSAAPTPLGGGTEISVARKAVPNNSTNWNTASAGTNSNKLVIDFITSAPSDLGEVVGIAEYDAATSGNLLTYGDLAAPKTILTGMTFSVLAGAGQFTYVDDTV